MAGGGAAERGGLGALFEGGPIELGYQGAGSGGVTSGVQVGVVCWGVKVWEALKIIIYVFKSKNLIIEIKFVLPKISCLTARAQAVSI